MRDRPASAITRPGRGRCGLDHVPGQRGDRIRIRRRICRPRSVDRNSCLQTCPFRQADALICRMSSTFDQSLLTCQLRHAGARKVSQVQVPSDSGPPSSSAPPRASAVKIAFRRDAGPSLLTGKQ